MKWKNAFTLVFFMISVAILSNMTANQFDNAIAPYANPYLGIVGFKVDPRCNTFETLNCIAGIILGSMVTYIACKKGWL